MCVCNTGSFQIRSSMAPGDQMYYVVIRNPRKDAREITLQLDCALFFREDGDFIADEFQERIKKLVTSFITKELKDKAKKQK